MKKITIILLFFSLVLNLSVNAQEKKIHKLFSELFTNKNNTLSLEFNDNGELLSPFPENLAIKKKKKWKIKVHSGFSLHNSEGILPLAENLLGVGEEKFYLYNGIKEKSIGSLSIYKLLLWQIHQRLYAIHSVLSSRSSEKAKDEKILSGFSSFLDTLSSDESRCLDGLSHKYPFLPRIDEIKYEISIIGYNGYKLPDTISYDVWPNMDTTIKVKKLYKEKFKSLKDADSIAFVLKKKQTTAAGIKKLLEKYPIPQDLNKLYNLKNYKSYKAFIERDSIKKTYTAVKNIDDINQLPDSIKDQVKRINKSIELNYEAFTDSLSTLYKNNYFYAFLWFTGGKVLANPFLYPESAPIDKTKDMKESIQKYQDSLSEVETKLPSYKEAATTNLYNSDALQEVAWHRYDSLLLRKLKLEKCIAQKKDSLEAHKEEIETYDDEKKKYENRMNNLSILNEGILYNNKKRKVVNKKNIQYIMRHHNAEDGFRVMGDTYLTEVAENQRMKILVHNKKPSINLSLAVHRGTAKEQGFSFLDQEIPKIEDLTEADKKEIKDFIRYYNILSPFSNGPISNFEAPEDKATANYVTKLLDHEWYEDSTLIRYNIKEKDKDNPIHRNGYRVNKLYRIRWKAGAIYSWLERKEYDISDGSVTQDINTHGLDATFGIQFFFTKQDVRSPKLAFRPFLYTGFSLSKSPIQNWYIGAGIEPLNGLALMGGLHLGEGERLVVNELNKITVEDKLVSGPFVSIGVDLNIFKRIFSFGDLNNPFKK